MRGKSKNQEWNQSTRYLRQLSYRTKHKRFTSHIMETAVVLVTGKSLSQTISNNAI